MFARDQLFSALRFLLIGVWCGFMLISAFRSGAWWQALAFAGLGSFVIQVAVAFARISAASGAPIQISEVQRRLSQLFVLMTAIGLVGTLVNRYA